MPTTFGTFEKLLWQAQLRGMVGNPDDRAYANALRDGKPIPEHCKPGYLVLKMSASEREALSRMTSDQIAGYGTRMMNDLAGIGTIISL